MRFRLRYCPAVTAATRDAAEWARKTWRTLEPIHGMIYFAPEAAAPARHQRHASIEAAHRDAQAGRPNSDVIRSDWTMAAMSASDGRRSKRSAASRTLGSSVRSPAVLR